jgi:hypothetical protein
MLLALPSTVLGATQETKISVSVNKLMVVVNDEFASGNNILYNGTTYVPIRNVADILGGLTVDFDAASGTVRFARGEAAAATTDNDERDPEFVGNIRVVINAVEIWVEGKRVEADNLVYKGRTYVPLRALSNALGVPVHFDQATEAVYIGDSAIEMMSVPPTAAGDAGPDLSGLSHVAASGEMAGWMVLKGHPFERTTAVYYKVDGTILSIHLQSIRDLDLNQVVNWVDDSGRQRTNTLRDLHTVFGLFSEYTTDWLYEKFGEHYVNYLEPSTIHVERLLEDYLDATGQMKSTRWEPAPIPEEPPAPPEPGYGTADDGSTYFEAYDHEGEYRGRFADASDIVYMTSRVERTPTPPLLSEGWMSEEIISDIFAGGASYDDEDKTFTIRTGYISEEPLLVLTFPDHWHQADALETTVDGIRVKKYMHPDHLVTEEWITKADLELQGYALSIEGTNAAGDWIYSIRGPYSEDHDGRPKLFELVVPKSWNGSKETHEMTANGLKVRQEDKILYFNSKDLKSLGILPESQILDRFYLYFNVEDLVAKGILQ